MMGDDIPAAITFKRKRRRRRKGGDEERVGCGGAADVGHSGGSRTGLVLEIISQLDERVPASDPPGRV